MFRLFQHAICPVPFLITGTKIALPVKTETVLATNQPYHYWFLLLHNFCENRGLCSNRNNSSRRRSLLFYNLLFDNGWGLWCLVNNSFGNEFLFFGDLLWAGCNRGYYFCFLLLHLFEWGLYNCFLLLYHNWRNYKGRLHNTTPSY